MRPRSGVREERQVIDPNVYNAGNFLNSAVPYLAILTRLVRTARQRLSYYYNSDSKPSGVLLTNYVYLPIITNSIHG